MTKIFYVSILLSLFIGATSSAQKSKAGSRKTAPAAPPQLTPEQKATEACVKDPKHCFKRVMAIESKLNETTEEHPQYLVPARWGRDDQMLLKAFTQTPDYKMGELNDYQSTAYFHKGKGEKKRTVVFTVIKYNKKTREAESLFRMSPGEGTDCKAPSLNNGVLTFPCEGGDEGTSWNFDYVVDLNKKVFHRKNAKVEFTE